MPDETGPLSQRERDELHRLRQEQQVRALVDPRIEEKICAALGVQYQANGSHWIEINERIEVNREMRDNWKRRKEDLAAARKTTVELVTGWIMRSTAGAAVIGALYWLGSKLNIKVTP